VSKCANYEQNKFQIYKKIDRLYVKQAFMVLKGDTFLHAQEIVIGQAGTKLANSHVGAAAMFNNIVMLETILTNCFC